MPASTKTKNNRKEIDAIADLNEHLMNFAPLLDLTVSELRTKKTKDLDISRLAGRSEADWEAKIKRVKGSIKYPDKYKTRTKPEKDYAHDIVESFISKYPTAAYCKNRANEN